MRKSILTIAIIIISLSGFAQSWEPIGWAGSLRVVAGEKQVRFNMGSRGFYSLTDTLKSLSNKFAPISPSGGYVYANSGTAQNANINLADNIVKTTKGINNFQSEQGASGFSVYYPPSGQKTIQEAGGYSIFQDGENGFTSYQRNNFTYNNGLSQIIQFTPPSTVNRTITIPDNSGTFVLSVNGNTPDATGNVTVSDRYGTIVDKSAPEIAPSELPGTTHNAFGFLAQTKQGDIFYFYREASEHVGTAGIIRYIKSTDGGKTFGIPVTMFTESGMDLRNLGGGVTKTGRIVVFYERYNYLDPANVTIYGSAYSYSDDNGLTWSTPVNKTNFEVPYGGMIEIDGKLMQSGYGIIGSNHTDVIYSTDNGTTWGSPQVVASSSSIAYSEASYSYLGNGNILGVVRDSPLTTGFRQFLSTNNGTSWTSQGVAAVDTTESVAPWLDITTDLEGKRLVSLYYHNRDNKTFKVVSARAQDIISSGVTAWDLKTKTTLRTFTTETDYGYPSVIHPNNSNYSLGAYYNGIKTGIVRTNFFTYSSPVGINTKVKYADALRGYGNVLHNIGLDYNGSTGKLSLKVDGFDFGSNFPINITGTAPIPTLNQVTSSGNNSSNAIYVSGSTGSTTGKALALTYQTGLDASALQSYDYTNSIAKNLLIQPSGANVVIGTTTDNGEKLQVNGKATVSTAPTNPTDVVRLQDLQNFTVSNDFTGTGTSVSPFSLATTGWASYADNAYTSGSPFSITSGTTSTLPNNAAVVINNQLPSGVTSFYNSSTQKITPHLSGDYYVTTIRFKAQTTAPTAGYFDFGIDIGGALGVQFKETKIFAKGAGIVHDFSIVVPMYVASTFIANGGIVKITSGNGTMTVYDINYQIERIHKAK